MCPQYEKGGCAEAGEQVFFKVRLKEEKTKNSAQLSKDVV